MMSKRFFVLVFVVVLLQCFFVCHYGMVKPSLFVDEWWSFNLANGKFPFLSTMPADAVGVRLTAEFWNSAVTVNWQDVFNFDSVWTNQAADTHPPFYYALLHVFCGLNGEKFSMMPAILLNVVFFVGSQILVVAILFNITKKSLWAFLVVLFYGFSLGAFSSVLSIRMYMMLTFFVLLSIFINIKIIEKQCKIKWTILLSVVHVFGFLTQYFYVVYAFFAGIIVLAHLMVHRKFRDIGMYVGLALLAMFVSWIIFPDFIHHIFGNWHGNQSFSNFAHTSVWERVKLMSEIFMRYSGLMVVGVVALLLSIFLIAKHWLAYRVDIVSDDSAEVEISIKRSWRPVVSLKFDSQCVKFLVLLSELIGAFIVLSKIVTYTEFRYIMPLVPVFVMGVAVFFDYVIDENVVGNRRFAFFTAVIFVFMVSVNTFHPSKIAWYWKDRKTITKVYEDNSNTTFVAVGRNASFWPLVSQGYALMRAKQSYYVTEDDMSALAGIPDEEKKSVVIWVSFDCRDGNKARNDARELMGIRNDWRPLYEDFGWLEHHVK